MQSPVAGFSLWKFLEFPFFFREDFPALKEAFCFIFSVFLTEKKREGPGYGLYTNPGAEEGWILRFQRNNLFYSLHSIFIKYRSLRIVLRFSQFRFFHF
ncbi:hypothetical protein DLM76_14475 [Leptospira yasudae]|nr:hypothetical protein DLM76_14475 [Leptospira yasudae]